MKNFIILFLLLFWVTAQAAQQRVTLAWDAPVDPTGVTGYVLHYGTSSGDYPNAIDCGLTTTRTVSNLVIGVTYYFVVKSTNEFGFESEPSNEVIYTAIGFGPLPIISNIIDQSIDEDTQSGPITFQVIDTNNPPQIVTISAISSIQKLVSNDRITISGTDSNKNLTILPSTNEFGNTTITVFAGNENGNVSSSFILTVNPINDQPTLGHIDDLHVKMNVPFKIIQLTNITSGATNENDTIDVTAVSDNSSILKDIDVTYNSLTDSAVLVLSPKENKIGTALVTVTVNDGNPSNNIVTQTFTVEVIVPPPINTFYVEAESGNLTSPMVVSIDQTALNWKFIYSTNSEEGSALYQINIPQEDEYVIWCRVQSSSGGTDSFIVKIDDNPEDVYDTVKTNMWSNTWQWTQVNGRGGVNESFTNAFKIDPIVFILGQGQHSVLFEGREPGTMMDALLITNDRNFIPTLRNPYKPTNFTFQGVTYE